MPAAIQAVANRVSGVHHYDDVFERIVRMGPLGEALGPMLRRRIDPDVRARGVLFIQVPKNAGTSIARAIYGHSTGHKTACFYRAADPAFFSKATPFAVLRDPVDRFLSAYWFIRHGGGEDVSIEPGFAKALAALHSVDDLLDHVESCLPGLYDLDHVLRPQHWYLRDNQGRIIIERLAIIGVHSHSLDLHLAALGINALPVSNRSQRGSAKLTLWQIQRIKHLYAQDVALINDVRRRGPPNRFIVGP